MKWIAMLCVLFAAACTPADSAVIVKICKDGTQIKKHSNGEYRAVLIGSPRVSGPEVCE